MYSVNQTSKQFSQVQFLLSVDNNDSIEFICIVLLVAIVKAIVTLTNTPNIDGKVSQSAAIDSDETKTWSNIFPIAVDKIMSVNRMNSFTSIIVYQLVTHAF